MAKLQDNVSELFACFNKAIGNDAVYGIICNQTAAMLGQLAITTTDGDWKVSASGVLSQAQKNKANLAMNNPCSILFATALEVRAIEKLRKVNLTSDIPSLCSDYVKQLVKKHATAPADAPQEA